MNSKDKMDFDNFMADIGIQYFVKRYSIIDEIKEIFTSNEKAFFSYILDESTTKEIFFDRVQRQLKSFHSYEDVESAKIIDLTRFFLIQTFSKRQVDFLDNLSNEKIHKKISFIVATRLANLTYGAYEILNSYNEREFQQCLLEANISNQNFLSFHCLNYIFNMESSILDSDGIHNLDKVLSIVGQDSFYKKKNIDRSRLFIYTALSRLKKLFQSGFYDEVLVEFMDEFNPSARQHYQADKVSTVLDFFGTHQPLSTNSQPFHMERMDFLLQR